MVFPISEKGNAQSHKTETSEQKRPSGSFKKHLNPPVPLPQKTRSTVFDLPKQKERPKEKEKTVHTHGHQQVQNRGVSGKANVSETSELSAEMIELTQKMADFITMESKKGIATMELILNLENPDSLFQGTGLMIEHYDTAPHSFNIELSHSLESAVSELTAQLPSLMKALQSRLEHFQINLLPPTYAKEKPIQKVRKPREEKKVDKLRESVHKWNEKN